MSTSDICPRWAVSSAIDLLEEIDPDAVPVELDELQDIIKGLNDVEHFRDDFPAHAGYCREDIDPDKKLTDDQFAEVCRRFNKGDFSQLHEALMDEVRYVLEETGGTGT